MRRGHMGGTFHRKPITPGKEDTAMAEYACPEMLVSTEWLAQHLNDLGLRIVEVDVDTSAYEQGHIHGAVGWNWQTQLCDQVRRDILTKEQFERLMSESSISN